MQSVGSFFSTVSRFYSEINPATLSGAVDVVVVEQPDGSLSCSPFHVRFGKLSILRPQEKVVEVTVNGRVADFPMKVGDAGEAFFVFETEQEVPDEFATSPLAGPSQDKAATLLFRLNQMTWAHTGYVSAHSDHSPDFDDMGSFDEGSPLSNAELHFAGRDRSSRNLTLEHSGIFVYPLDTRLSASRSRFSLSVSLPSSPGLKPRDIMENFQPVEYSRRHQNKATSKEVGTPSMSSPSNTAEHREFLTPHQDNVIMDMTGYKTDDSAETDLDSDVPSRGANGLRNRTGKKRRVKCLVPSTVNQIPGQDVESERLDKLRFPLTSVQHSQVRLAPILAKKKRSSSLPNLRERGVWRIIAPSRTNADNATGESDPMDTASANLPSLDIPSSSSSATASPPLSNETNQFQHIHRHHRHHHNRQNETGQPQHRHHGHRSRHKDESQVHTPKTPRLNVAVSALSDTELEYQTPRSAKATQDTEWTWGWGSLPVKSDGIDDIAEADKGEDSHISIEMPPAPKPLLNEMEVDGIVASEALFASNQISFEEFSKDPLKIINNKSLVCLINDRYFTWAVAGAYLTSLMLFRKPLSDETLHQLSLKDSRQLSDLSEDRTQAADPPTRFGVLSRWLRGSQTSAQLPTAGDDRRQRSPSAGSEIKASVDEMYSTSSVTTQKHSEEPIGDSMLHEREPMTRSLSMPIGTGRAGSISSEGTLNGRIQSLIPHSKRYAKTLRLTSDQLKSLNLKKGSNTLTFSVTSSYQGKAVCTAKLFLWEHDYQVVISDIDGTITKSDALGHIFTMAGKDWTHSGVAKLYTDITNNGYHILYLTSRAIGQADYTRKYLKNVEQDSYQLPDGPVIMSPDRLFTAFHREVIMRKPEEFKMACLRDIKRLFGDRNPFYAGFGNRITDALSYRSVDVPPSKIFTISPDGKVTLELLSTYQSSYIALNDLVNEIFPGSRHATEFNDWNYWKPTLPSIELPLAPSPQPTLPKPGESRSNSANSSSGLNSNGPTRLGVIRSFTSSLSFTGPLKKRASIPAFGSSPSTPPTIHSSLLASKQQMSFSARTSPTPPRLSHPPSSAPGGLQLADRTRRLSLSLMKHNGNPGALPASSPPSASVHDRDMRRSSSPQHVPAPPQAQRSRGLSFTSLSFVSSGLRGSEAMSATSSYVTSPSLPSTDAAPHAEIVHPLDIPTVQRQPSGFSVSPPQLASRLSETVIPYLRGHLSKSPETQQSAVFSEEHSQGYRANLHSFGEKHHEHFYEELTYEARGQYETFEDDKYVEEEYEEYQGEEEIVFEEGSVDEEDDVELNLDAPFL
ncbi:hypothetical protein BGZ92_006086 [Podila epicladia]|nr:hypothetical protein BGZ92_006086 [Podila epicladia]